MRTAILHITSTWRAAPPRAARRRRSCARALVGSNGHAASFAFPCQEQA